MSVKKVAIIIGSLRKGSLNHKLAVEMVKLAPATLQFQFVEIGNLPLYNEDLETASCPEAWTTFRKQLSEVDAVLFFTPEYNRSIPGCLKNAIDVGSRPWGKSIWAGKVGGVVSSSQGSMGGFGANHHLRQCLVHLDVTTVQQPEMYIPSVQKMFNEKGEIANDESKKLLQTFVDALAKKVAH
jgi:chromate reductase